MAGQEAPAHHVGRLPDSGKELLVSRCRRRLRSGTGRQWPTTVSFAGYRGAHEYGRDRPDRLRSRRRASPEWPVSGGCRRARIRSGRARDDLRCQCRGPACGGAAESGDGFGILLGVQARCAPPQISCARSGASGCGMVLNGAGCSRSSCPCHSVCGILTAGAVDSQARPRKDRRSPQPGMHPACRSPTRDRAGPSAGARPLRGVRSGSRGWVAWQVSSVQQDGVVANPASNIAVAAPAVRTPTATTS